MSGAHPRDEREWRREVERRLMNIRSGVTALYGSLPTIIENNIIEYAGKQPTAPIELVSQTQLYVDSITGRWRGRYILDFPDVTESTDDYVIPISHYELWGQDRTGVGQFDEPPYVQMAVSGTSSLVTHDLEPGSVWRFKARAMGSESLVPGQYSIVQNVTITTDTTAPPQPTAPIATANRGSIKVTWDGLSVSGAMPGDFKYAELAAGSEPNPTEVVALFQREGGFTIISGTPYYDTQFFRLRAVDWAGNYSAWSEQDDAFTTPLVDTDIILSTIDAAETQLINVDAGVSILSDTILTRHLVITESMTVALLAAHQIVAGDIAANAITADEINAGAVTAPKLTSQLVLTTSVIAGAVAGNHARMDPSGFKGFILDSVDGIPNEAIRLGTNGDDFLSITSADNVSRCTITRDGIGSFHGLNATDHLYYKGTELQKVIDDRGKGIVGATSRSTTSLYNAWIGGPLQPYLRLDVWLEPYRMYKVWTSPITLRGGSGLGIHASLLYEYDNPATTGSFQLVEAYSPPGEIGQADTDRNVDLQAIFAFPDTVTRKVSFLIGFGIHAVATSGTGEAQIKSSSSLPVQLVVEDLGPTSSKNNLGVSVNGAPQGQTQPAPPPAVGDYTKTYACTNSMNYQGSGAQYTYNTAVCYQGLSPTGYGNLKSIALFNKTQIVADLTNATVHRIRVYFNFTHWYYNSGGTARIGVHGHTGVPSTYTGVGPLFAVSTGWPKPGARWIDIPGTHFASFKSGAYCGVYLEGDSTYTTYGIANRPTLEIVYSK